jgi:putative endonuclease
MVTVYVYILRCADGSYFVGKYQGDRLEGRVADHNNGVYPDAYTAKRHPVTLIWSTWFGRYDEAVAFERKLKGWSRAKKEALIRGDEAALKALSKRGVKPSLILRDAALRAAPQDEVCVFLHPEEPQSGVTKGEGTARQSILRHASLRCAPQDEERQR